MIIVCALHTYHRTEHVHAVAELMRTLGPPVLRGHLDQETGAWLMREGTHRLLAALALGVAPVLVPIPWWRSRASLERARHAAAARGHRFPAVVVAQDMAKGGPSHG